VIQTWQGYRSSREGGKENRERRKSERTRVEIGKEQPYEACGLFLMGFGASTSGGGRKEAIQEGGGI